KGCSFLMPNPTTAWNWTLPYENQDPWYPAIASTFDQIDATVGSVQQIALAPRTTSLFSYFFATGVMLINSTTMVPMGADGNWTVLSAAPFGRFVNSFTLIASGAQACFQFLVGGTATNATRVADLAGGLTLRFRLVVTAPTANSLVVPSNSYWLF